MHKKLTSRMELQSAMPVSWRRAISTFGLVNALSDCSLSVIVDLLDVIRQSETYSSYVPAYKQKSWSLFISFFSAWCGIYGSLVRRISPLALRTQQGRQDVAGKQLTDLGLLSFRREVAIQWDATISITVDSSPRRAFPTPIAVSL
jgi:hypothetical protein